LLAGHEQVAVGVLLDVLETLTCVLHEMLFICSRRRRISCARMSMSLGCPCTPPGWWIMMRACGSANRFPLAPAARSHAAMLAACPMQSVEISGFRYCMVS